MEVTYDPAKRQVTLERRGLDFEDAPAIFNGLHYSRPDDRVDYGEERVITVGVLWGEVVVVVWTERDASRRIISMRKADRDERAEYYRMD